MSQIIQQKLYKDYTLINNKEVGYRWSMGHYKKNVKKYAQISLLCIVATLACLFSKNKIVRTAPVPFDVVALVQLARYKTKERKCQKQLNTLAIQRRQLLSNFQGGFK